MDQYGIDFMAKTVLPRLAGLAEARKQASYQAASAAGEHKVVWRDVIDALDREIAELEHLVTQRLELNRFVWKKEIRP